MPNANTVILVGHLSRDLEVNFTADGKAIGKSAICVNNGWGDKKKPCFIDFTCFGKTAEFAKKFLSKGSAAYLEGYLEQQEWTDKNTGAKRSKHALVVNKLESLGGGGGKAAAPSAASSDEVDDLPF